MTQNPPATENKKAKLFGYFSKWAVAKKAATMAKAAEKNLPWISQQFALIIHCYTQRHTIVHVVIIWTIFQNW